MVASTSARWPSAGKTAHGVRRRRENAGHRHGCGRHRNIPAPGQRPMPSSRCLRGWHCARPARSCHLKCRQSPSTRTSPGKRPWVESKRVRYFDARHVGKIIDRNNFKPGIRPSLEQSTQDATTNAAVAVECNFVATRLRHGVLDYLGKRVAVRPHSRASPLPQLKCIPMWEGLLAKRPVQPPQSTA
ncbi:hypothetical protein Ddc_21215 [Ditylenchus destructor]|nr:hypothetical protein Ddc_21215 [Ditylenchus destructor]